MAASVWALADNLLVEHIYSVTQPNAKSWLFNLMETLPYIQFTRVAITLWAIWTSRRKAIHEEIFQSPLSTYSFVNLYLAELQAIATPAPTAQALAPRPSGHARWIPPLKAIPKINVDAAVSKTEMRGVASTFCWDNSGFYLGASAVVFNGITDPSMLETLACREALALAEDLNLDRAFIVSDSKTAVDDRSSRRLDLVALFYATVVLPLKVELQILKHTI
jgi:hypothetical protein